MALRQDDLGVRVGGKKFVDEHDAWNIGNSLVVLAKPRRLEIQRQLLQAYTVIFQELVKLRFLIWPPFAGIFGFQCLKPVGERLGLCCLYDVIRLVAKLVESRLHCYTGSVLLADFAKREYKHMVPVRDMPRASTCISTGRGVVVGTLSMSLLALEDMFDSSVSIGR